jgi:hypothetical protein
MREKPGDVWKISATYEVVDDLPVRAVPADDEESLQRSPTPSPAQEARRSHRTARAA